MARCEDFPCCGHEAGCCPDYDSAGRQLNMKCTCGATLPLTSRYSICETCLRRGEDGEDCFDPQDVEDAEDHEEEDEELRRDEMLAQQELEDYEGLNGPFECYPED